MRLDSPRARSFRERTRPMSMARCLATSKSTSDAVRRCRCRATWVLGVSVIGPKGTHPGDACCRFLAEGLPCRDVRVLPVSNEKMYGGPKVDDNLKKWLPWIAVAAVALIVIVIIAINSGGDDEASATTTTAGETTTTVVEETTTTEAGETTTTEAGGGVPEAGPLGAVIVAPGEDIQIRSLEAISGDVALLGVPNQRGTELAITDFGPIQCHDVSIGTPLDDLCPAHGRAAAGPPIATNGVRPSRRGNASLRPTRGSTR